MTPDLLLRILQQSLLLVVMLSAPVVCSCLAIGLLVSVLQAATQVNEQTLAFAAKIVVATIVLALSGLWMMKQLIIFGGGLLAYIPFV